MISGLLPYCESTVALATSLRAKNLTLNMTKTEFVLIGSRQRLSTVTVSPTLAINDFRVTQVATAKSLAVTIDDNLDCGSHMEKIVKKVFSGIGAIKRVRGTLSPKRPYN